jgi:hypothetical protein
MSSSEIEGIFDVEEEKPLNPAEQQHNFEYPTESPSNFLNNLPTDLQQQQQQQPEMPSSSSFKTAEFIPVISPSLMLSSMANSSPVTENILSSARERMSQIRPWKDFFALDQFRIPESSTAAQSRASHNFTHFQNNYLLILFLFFGFSLLSDLALLMVAAVCLGGFYFISTLKPDYVLTVGGQEISVKQLNYGWIAVSVILLYMSSALSVVFWILSVTAVITVAHAALHDVILMQQFSLFS